MEVSAAEQLFERVDGGVSSLLWIDHPRRGLVFLLHDHGHWRGWPDTWDGQPVAVAGAERGFAHLVQRAGLELVIGQAIRPEQPYRVEMEELDDVPVPGTGTGTGGWKLTDSRGRTLRLVVGPVRWMVEKWPEYRG